MAGKLSARRRVSSSTTAPMAPRTRSSHMNQKRCCPGVPNRYRIRSRSRERRPKSMATVVVCLFGVWARSSMPAEASVITASVVSGTISETAPTNVVLPTPKPPATTIFVDVSPPPLEPAKSTEYPFKHVEVGLSLAEARLVQADESFVGHVRDQHASHSQGEAQQRRDLGDRPERPAERHDGLLLRGEQGHLVVRDRHRGDEGLQGQVVSGFRSSTGDCVGTEQRFVVPCSVTSVHRAVPSWTSPGPSGLELGAE